MDGQYTSSGFQLYGQPLQAVSVQQGGQPLNQPAPPPQQVSGFTIIPAAPAAGQPTMANLRQQPVQILQQPAPAPPKTQQSAVGAVSFQPAQSHDRQLQQQRLQPAQLQGLTSQQIQFLQAAQPGVQMTPGFQTVSQAPPQLGAIQILQPKPQPGPTAGRPFQPGQPAVHGMQILPQAAPQSFQPAQNLQGLGVQQVPGLQTIPGVQVLQQFPGLTSQVNAAPQQKQGPVGSGFQPPGHHHQTVGGLPGTAAGGRHTGSLFSNSNQSRGYGQQRLPWGDRDGNHRPDMRGHPRDRNRRDDRGPFGSHMQAREQVGPRMGREREPFRHDRVGRDRYDRVGRDYNRRPKDFSKERKQPSPTHHAYDLKKEEVRKDVRKDFFAKPANFSVPKELKMPPQPMPPVPKPPPVADYVVKVPQVPFVTYERDYSDIARRYTHLHVSPDFTRLICHWVKCSPAVRYPYGCCLCPLNKPVKFEMVQGPHEADQEIILPATKNDVDAPIRWNTKCTFISGLDEKSYRDVLKGKFEGGSHLMNALKFVTVREEKDKKKTGIMCLGGPYDPHIDGGNPDSDDQGLKNACVRHVKAQTLLDLTPCTTWIRFCDVHYSRVDPDGRECQEVTVIFIVDISAIIPSAEDWPDIWKEQKEWKQKVLQLDMSQTAIKTGTEASQQGGSDAAKAGQADDAAVGEPGLMAANQDVSTPQTEDVPKDISVLLKCRSAQNGRVKTMSISLDGLLDYDEGDKDEATFELSLMAESFNEMLMRDYGSLILKALMEQKTLTEPANDEKKRPVTEIIPGVPDPQVKKQRQDETPTKVEMSEELPKDDTADDLAASTEMDIQLTDSPGDVIIVGDIEMPEETTTKEAFASAVPVEHQEVIDVTLEETRQETPTADVEMTEADTKPAGPLVNEELLFAFRYFDRGGCGYIKCDDLRRLLHNLGCCLAPRVVRELVHGAAAMNKEKHDRVFYRTMTDKETNASL